MTDPFRITRADIRRIEQALGKPFSEVTFDDLRRANIAMRAKLDQLDAEIRDIDNRLDGGGR